LSIEERDIILPRAKPHVHVALALMNTAKLTCKARKHLPWRNTIPVRQTLPKRTAKPWQHWKKKTKGARRLLNLRQNTSNLTKARIKHER
jgi:hypothetical protein